MAVLLGLPWLAAAIGSLFTSVVAWLSVYVTKKIAVTIAAIAALASLTAAFVLALEGAASAFTYTFPIAANVGFIVPPDVPLLIAAYTSVRLLYWAYRWNIKIVQLRLF